VEDLTGGRVGPFKLQTALLLGRPSADARCISGVSQEATGVVLGEPGFGWENEEGETACWLDGEKVFSPKAEQIDGLR